MLRSVRLAAVLLLGLLPLSGCRYAPITWTIRVIAEVTDNHGNPIGGQNIIINVIQIARDSTEIPGTDAGGTRTTDAEGLAAFIFDTELNQDRSTGTYTEGIKATAHFISGGTTLRDDICWFPSDTATTHVADITLHIQFP
jgi:hypothetical protein